MLQRKFVILSMLLMLSVFGFSAGGKTHGKLLSVVTPSATVAPKVTFIELGSEKCMPCKMMKPVMKQVEEKFPDQVKVVFYDVWTEDGAPYAKGFGIRVIPTQIFLDSNGKEYARHEGYFPYEELVKILEKKGVK